MRNNTVTANIAFRSLNLPTSFVRFDEAKGMIIDNVKKKMFIDDLACFDVDSISIDSLMQIDGKCEVECRLLPKKGRESISDEHSINSPIVVISFLDSVILFPNVIMMQFLSSQPNVLCRDSLVGGKFEEKNILDLVEGDEVVFVGDKTRWSFRKISNIKIVTGDNFPDESDLATGRIEDLINHVVRMGRKTKQQAIAVNGLVLV